MCSSFLSHETNWHGRTALDTLPGNSALSPGGASLTARARVDFDSPIPVQERSVSKHPEREWRDLSAVSRQRLSLRGALIAVATAGVVTALAPITSLEGKPGPAVLYIVAVIAATAAGGFWAGLVSAALSFLGLLYFFTTPIHSFDVDASGIAALVAFIVATLLTSHVVGRLQTLRERADHSERRLQTILSSSPLPVVAVDADGHVTLWNPAAERAFGWKEEELLGEPLPWVPADLRTEYQHRLANVLAGEYETNIETRRLRADGTMAEVSISSARLVNEAGEPEGVVALVNDISDRKQAELERERLHEAEQEARRAAVQAALRITRLQSITAALSEALTPEDIGDVVVQEATAATEAGACSLYVSREVGARIEIVSSVGLRGVGPASEDPSGIALAQRVVETGEPLWLTSLSELADRYPDAADEWQASSIESGGFVPLLTGPGRPIGVLSFGFDKSRTFDETERSFIRAIASECAHALERSRLYQREHDIAVSLQRSFLPAELPNIPGVQVAAHYLPAVERTLVGGDWYDCIELRDGRVVIVVGDIVGHGIEAATVMGQVRNSLRVIALQDEKPAVVLSELNQIVLGMGHGAMATLVYMLIDPRTGATRYASAGHPPPVVIDSDNDAEFLEGGRSPPVGVEPSSAIPEGEIRLKPGSALLLYTDGLVERRDRNIDAGLTELLRTIASSTLEPPDLLPQLVGDLIPPGSPEDDVAVLVLKYEGVATDRLSFTVPAEPQALAKARHAVEGALESSGADRHELFEISMSLGEALTNVVEHAYPLGDGEIEIGVHREDDVVEILVRDTGQWQDPSETGDRGLGLVLCQALMDSLDIDARPEGTTVRMRRRLSTTPRV